MTANNLPLTRQNYMQVAYGTTMPQSWTVEDELNMPAQFRQSTAFDPAAPQKQAAAATEARLAAEAAQQQAQPQQQQLPGGLTQQQWNTLAPEQQQWWQSLTPEQIQQWQDLMNRTNQPTTTTPDFTGVIPTGQSTPGDRG